MDVVLLDEYVNDRCGEVYLSNDGVLIFLCTLCNETFKGYGFYLQHILYEHDLPVYSVEDETPTATTTETTYGNDEEMQLYYYDEQQNDIDECDSIKSEVELTSENNEGNEYQSEQCEDQNDFQQEEIQIEQDTEAYQLQENPPEENPRRRTKENKKTSADFECPYCKMKIKGKSNLDKHILRHNDKNKRYQCSYCPKRFHVRFEKFQHECSHTGERRYLCTECGKGFVSNGKLNEHINMIHKNLRSKQCEICLKNFYSNKYLKRHMLVHQNDRNHKCNKCGATFKLRKTLLAHNKLHENKLEHKCQLCNAKFNQRPALHSHIKTRHKEELKVETS